MLFAHQVVGAEWLAQRSRAYLGDAAGTGKSRTLIAGLLGIRERADGTLCNSREGRLAQRPLVVCPAIVRSHWTREFARLEPDPPPGFGPVIMSYNEIVNGRYDLMATLIQNQKVDALILDEAHYLKSVDAERSRIILGKDGYARRLPRVWLASGTPIPKNPGELGTVVCSIFPDVALKHKMKYPSDFVDRFCVTVPVRTHAGVWRDKVVGTQNINELHDILGEIMLRREPGPDVPRVWWQTLLLDGSGETKLDTYEDGLEVRHALDLGESFAEIANEPHIARMRRRLGELKAPLVGQMLREELTDSTEKVVVFAHHRTVLNHLSHFVAPFGYAYIDGYTSQSERDKAVERFRGDPTCRVFLGQQLACGTGMDGLQYGARRAIFVEPDWTATNNAQAAARIARLGQSGRCVAQMIALAGTLDEAIVRQNERETRMVSESLEVA